MLDYLDKLRAKPVHVRQRIAWAATLALSFLVASVWWASWNVGDPANTTSALTQASTRSPWGVVSDMFKEAKEETMAAVVQVTGQLQNVTESNIEYAPTEQEEMNTDANEYPEDQSAAPDVSDSYSSEMSGETSTNDMPLSNSGGGFIRTRPGIYQTAPSETVSGSDVLE